MAVTLCWDIDLTLLTTARAGIFAWQDALEAAGVTIDLNSHPTAGLTDAAIAAEIAALAGPFARDRAAALLAEYERRLPEALPRRQGRVLEGVKPILDYLAAQDNVLLLLLTGNTPVGAAAKLRHYGLDGYFDAGAFCERDEPRSEIAKRARRVARRRLGAAFDPEAFFVIGDTPHDIECGAAVGARTIALATGVYSREQLEEHRPWLVLDRLPGPEEFARIVGLPRRSGHVRAFRSGKPSAGTRSGVVERLVRVLTTFTGIRLFLISALSRMVARPASRRARETPNAQVTLESVDAAPDGAGPEHIGPTRREPSLPSDLPGQAWSFIGPRRRGVWQQTKDLWTYRKLVPYLAGRLFEKVTIRSKLGNLWIPLRPVLSVLTRALVFGGILAAPSGPVPYLVFFLTGMAVWAIFDRALYWGVRSIELNARLLQKVYFPRLLMPFSAFIPAAVDFVIYLAMLVLLLAGYGVFAGENFLETDAGLLLVPAGLVLVLAMALGLTVWLAVLGTYTRDFRFGLSYLLGFWIYLTPIIYPLSAIPAQFRDFASLNPMTAPVEMIRKGLYGSGDVTDIALASSLGVAVVALVTGLVFFGRWEAAAVDTL